MQCTLLQILPLVEQKQIHWDRQVKLEAALEAGQIKYQLSVVSWQPIMTYDIQNHLEHFGIISIILRSFY